MSFRIPISLTRGLFVGALFFLFAINITAQKQQQTSTVEAASNNGVSFNNIESYVYNGSLHVSFDLELQGRFFASGDALHIVPVYRTGTDEIRLIEILVNGKKRSSYYKREQSLLSKSERLANKPYAEIVRNDNEKQHLTYSYVMPIPEGVSRTGTLHIEQLLEDCCDLAVVDTKLLPLEYRATRPDPSIFVNTLTFITPEAEQVKKRNHQIVVRIDYPVDKYEVVPSFADNKAELEKIDKELNSLFTDKKTYKIANAVIKGYASPEDTYEYNLNLSRRRTDTFQKFLVQKYGLTDLHNFPSQGMGEDWEGLLRAVESSNMEHRDEVVNIINTVGIFDSRETQLMELAGGKPYSYMLKELYPPLRRMEMEINYTVRPFDSNEVESFIKERPTGLSQREIFDLAQNKKDVELLKIAAIYFPEDPIANINASSVALKKGNVDEAWTYLSKVQDKPEASNNLGIYYWLSGDTNKAESYFRQAVYVESQKENAQANLKLLKEYLMR